MGLDAGIYKVKTKNVDEYKSLVANYFGENSRELTKEEENRLEEIREEIVYFRKFYELDQIMNFYGEYLLEKEDFFVTLDTPSLQKLYNSLKSCYPLLLRLTSKQISDLEDGVKDLKDFFKQDEIDIIEDCLYKTELEQDGSAFFYSKLVRWIGFLDYWFNIYESSNLKEYTFIYYRSY